MDASVKWHSLLSAQAKSISGKPEGPWRAVEAVSQLSSSVFPECSTVDEQFARAVELYSANKCLGTRELLREEEEQQPNGRVFKKVTLPCLCSSVRLCCLMSSDVHWHIWDKQRPMREHGSVNLYVHGSQKARWGAAAAQWTRL